MMSGCLSCSRWIGAAVLAIGFQLPVYAVDFTPPDLAGYDLHTEHDADGDDDGVNETHIRQYFNPGGDSIFSMTTGTYLWAWSLDTRDNDAGTKNYVIRDSDCDGTFDEVYGLNEEFHVPDCAMPASP